MKPIEPEAALKARDLMNQIDTNFDGLFTADQGLAAAQVWALLALAEALSGAKK